MRVESLLIGALLVQSLLAGEYSERWVRVGLTVGKPADVATFRGIVSEAKKAGYTGILWSSGMDFMSCWPNQRRAAFRAARDFCREQGIEIIPDIWGVGYGCMMNYGYDLMEGVRVARTIYTAGVTSAVPEKGTCDFPNGGFEQVGKRDWPNWGYVDGVGTFSHRDVQEKCEGASSLRFDLSPTNATAMARFSRRFVLKKDGRYRYSFKIKTRDLSVSNFDVYLHSSRKYTPPARKGGSIQGWHVKLAANQDWTEYAFDFSTAVESDLVCYAGFWKKGTGSFWVDDARLEEVPPQAILRNPGAPVTLTNVETGARYEEGRDFTVPKVHQRKWKTSDPFAELGIPAGSAIKPGMKLALECYTPAVTFGDQVSLCISNPRLYEVLARSARMIADEVAPKKWMIGLDEVRNGNTCALCTARNTDMAHLTADSFKKMYDIIRRVSPNAEIFTWNDMLDPNHNACEAYYAARGTWLGLAEMLPRDVTVVCWHEGKCAESLDFFSKLGFRTMFAGFYDRKDLKKDRACLEICSRTPGCRGLMYTSWCGDYSKMGAYAEMLRNEGKAK